MPAWNAKAMPCIQSASTRAPSSAGEAAARRIMESDPPYDATVWARLGAELGVLGLSVPEADGGAGGTLVDQVHYDPHAGLMAVLARAERAPAPAVRARNRSMDSPLPPSTPVSNFLAPPG